MPAMPHEENTFPVLTFKSSSFGASFLPFKVITVGPLVGGFKHTVYTVFDLQP